MSVFVSFFSHVFQLDSKKFRSMDGWRRQGRNYGGEEAEEVEGRVVKLSNVGITITKKQHGPKKAW